MQLEPKEQDTLRQYLLGRLPSGEAGPLEERLLTDSAFYEELLILEDELIDQYVRGEQSEEDRESFQSHFLLTAERQRKTRFARSLKQYLDGLEPALSEQPAGGARASDGATSTPDTVSGKRSFFSFFSQYPVLSYSLAAALVLVVGAVSWTALRNPRTPIAPESGPVLAVVLTPGLTRGEGDKSPRFQIPSGVSTLQLNLVLLSAAHQNYRAELITSERTSIWASDGLQVDLASSTKSIV